MSYVRIGFVGCLLGIGGLLGACSDETGGTSSTTSSSSSTSSSTSTSTSSSTSSSSSTSTSTSSSSSSGSAAVWEVVKGFSGAESCIWDETNKVWYVSNMSPPANGDLLTPDGVGWISQLDENGAVVKDKWVEGFDTPAGLRIHKGVLYVANINKVHGIDIATAAVTENYNFPAAVLLNDPSVNPADDMAYVSDTFGNVIYSFKAGTIGSEDFLVNSAELMGPNGTLVEGNTLLVASLMDFDPATTGPFLSIDLGTKAITPIGTAKAKWDGLEKDGDDYILSDNPKSQIVRIKKDGTSSVALDLMKDHNYSPAADIGYDPARRLLCVPNLGDSVAFVTLPMP